MRRPDAVIGRTVPFSRLPRDLPDPADPAWLDVGAGRWRFADHITLGEARTVVKLLRLLCAAPGAHRSKTLSLQDNLATVGSFTKVRSPAPSIAFLLRQRTAVTLAGELHAILPWIQTSAMAADGASRMLPASPRASSA